jgi:hypothetical protein
MRSQLLLDQSFQTDPSRRFYELSNASDELASVLHAGSRIVDASTTDVVDSCVSMGHSPGVHIQLERMQMMRVVPVN